MISASELLQDTRRGPSGSTIELTAVDLRRRGVGWIASITSGGSSVKRLYTAAVDIADFDPLAAIQPNSAMWRPASVHCPALARLESFRLAGGGLLLSKWNGHRPHRLRHGSHSPRTRPLLVGTESSNPSPSSEESGELDLVDQKRDKALPPENARHDGGFHVTVANTPPSSLQLALHGRGYRPPN